MKSWLPLSFIVQNVGALPTQYCELEVNIFVLPLCFGINCSILEIIPMWVNQLDLSYFNHDNNNYPILSSMVAMHRDFPKI